MARGLSYVKGYGGLRGLSGSPFGHKAVEDLLYNDPAHSPSHYLGATMGIRLTIDAQGYINGLRNLMDAQGDFPREELVAQHAARELQHAIQRHTPIGPYRDTSMSKADSIGAYTGASMGSMYDDSPWASGIVTKETLDAIQGRYVSDARKLEADLAEVEKQLAFVNGIGGRRSGSQYKWAQRFVTGLSKEEAAFRKGKGLRRAKLATVRKRTTVIAGSLNPSGRLYDSIVAEGRGVRGGANLSATSTSYYAWFVEHGVVQAMSPTWNIAKGPEGPDTRLPLWQLGNYPYFMGLVRDRAEKRGGGEDTNPWIGFISSGNTDAYSVTQRAGDQGGLNYRVGGKAERGPMTATTKGAHMFERGFRDFEEKIMPRMRREFNKKMAVAFARG